MSSLFLVKLNIAINIIIKVTLYTKGYRASAEVSGIILKQELFYGSFLSRNFLKMRGIIR